MPNASQYCGDINKQTCLCYMIKKAAVFGGPANLHDTCGNYGNLVVPDTGIYLERTPDTFKGRGITTGL